MIVANTGSVSLSYDGDRRAAYLLLDNLRPAIRRGLQRRLRAQSSFRLRPPAFRLGCEDPHKRQSPDAITIPPAHVTQVKGFSKC